MQTKKRLGEILVELGVMDGLQLQSALAYQRKWGVPLGQVVVDLRFCTRADGEDLVQRFRQSTAQSQVPLERLQTNPFLMELASTVPVVENNSVSQRRRD